MVKAVSQLEDDKYFGPGVGPNAANLSLTC